jgi:hypothetical protein
MMHGTRRSVPVVSVPVLVAIIIDRQLFFQQQRLIVVLNPTQTAARFKQLEILLTTSYRISALSPDPSDITCFTMTNFPRALLLVLVCCLTACSFVLMPSGRMHRIGCAKHGSVYFLPTHRRRYLLHATAETKLSDRFVTNDRFDRWRFLQNLLDGEAKALTVNQMLYYVLDGFLKYPRPKQENSDETGSPELTAELRAKIEKILDESVDESIAALEDPECVPGRGFALLELEGLLPDPQEEEEVFKSLWDVVIEVHGREMVKIEESKATPQWKAWCLIARLFIHFDFVVYGLVDSPLV